MSSVLKWAESLDKSKRGKPSEQIKKELFKRIQTALAEDEDPVSDCVYSLFKFDAKVVDPFYDKYYWEFKEDLKNVWDRTVISWAKETKTSGTALSRIILILCNKVSHSGNTTSVREELLWLALCDDNKKNERIAALARKGDRDLLMKLLTLDMDGWTVGQIGVAKIYSILFSENKDPEIVKLYQDFLIRNHLKQETEIKNKTAMENALSETSTSAKDNSQKQGDTDQPETTAQNSERSEASEGNNDTDEQKNSEQQNQTITEKQNQGKEKASNPGTRSRAPGINPLDGGALAENLLLWVRNNKGLVMRLQTELSEQKQTIKKLTEERDDLAEEREKLVNNEDAYQNQIVSLKKEIDSLEEQLHAANFSAATLQEEKEDIENKLRQVQLMGNNSVKQEVGGLRTSLAEDLKHTIQDFRSDLSDMSDADKCEVYKTLMEEMIDTLNHHHIVVEEN